MTDTPPNPKRRRWRWLVAGLLLLLGTARGIQLNEYRHEWRRLGLIEKIKPHGAFAGMYASKQGMFADLPYVDRLAWRRGVIVHIPNADVAEAVVPLLTDDVDLVTIQSPVFDALVERVRAAVPTAELRSDDRYHPF